MLAHSVSLIKNAMLRQKWVLLAMLFVLLCFWITLQHTARQGVARSLAAQETSSEVLLHALEDAVVRTFSSVNNAMQTLSERIAHANPPFDISTVLREQLYASPQIRAIDVLTTQGVVVASVTKSVGVQMDYSCLAVLANEPHTEFVIENPRQGRYPHDLFAAQSAHSYIPLCVPVHDAQGQLSQVLVASIKPQYFYNLFASVTESFGFYIHLYRYDGQKLLSVGEVEPSMQALLQQVKERSWGQLRETIVGDKFLVSFRSTSVLPLVLVLLSDETSALAAWLHDEQMMRWFLLIISCVTIVASLVIVVLREKRWQAQGDIRLLSTAIRSTANAIFITNKKGDIYWINNAFTLLTGYSFEEINGKNPRILNSGYQHKDFYKALWATILEGQSWRGELINRHKLGHTLVVEQTITPILDKNGQVEYFIAVHEDVTARKNAEEKAVYVADHDALTGLPNRRYFERHLDRVFKYANSMEVAVIFINLDRFKDINDSMGHAAGDALLIHTTANLQALLDESHVLARLGGDEFAILVKNVTNQDQLTHLASNVVTAITKSFHYDDAVFNMTCSAGVAIGNQKNSDAANMLRQANIAMYRAKREGKNTFRFFDKEMDELIKRRVYLQQHIDLALQSGAGFSLRYQPQVYTHNGSLAGAEVLMRWEIAEGDWVPPDEFITLAEETGQILEVGIWLMQNLFAQMAEWNSRGVNYGKISINISAVQLARDTLAQRMLALMETFSIAPEQVCVEITETTLMTNSELGMNNLKLIKDAGISLSIDDFGTGYSSLSYLNALDADELKIDRSFILGIGGQGSDEHIVRATIALAHSLNLATVAEGVDSYEQLEFLQSLSCDYIQGYLFSKPLMAEEYERFIQEQPGVHMITGSV